ncbi:hypothetical protein EYF80_003000 [Liparis tanakae]|uniref:Uncharacterized protein n=1 Tax=Liparis tanakae TaxID=230148 RepID=A0A4Z2J9U6_9TELE|nr:hypothetical protein EYF80_003000 [Liparis tanakae]
MNWRRTSLSVSPEGEVGRAAGPPGPPRCGPPLCAEEGLSSGAQLSHAPRRGELPRQSRPASVQLPWTHIHSQHAID